MKDRARFAYVAFFLSVLLSKSAPLPHTTLALEEQRPLIVQAKPTPTPSPLLPTNYTASDVYEGLLQTGLLLQVTFSQSIDFGPVAPSDFIAFQGKNNVANTYTLAVYQTYTDAHMGYLYIKNKGTSVLYRHARCMLIAPANTLAPNALVDALQRLCY